jgi:cell division protein FtsL
MAHGFIQAYRQAPWRIQIQRIGSILLLMVIAALVAGVYLSISAQSSAIGVEIQVLENDREDLQREIASLKNQIGVLTSAVEMEKRAKEMGFEKATSYNMEYLLVPGYPGRQTAMLAPFSGTEAASRQVSNPGFTTSLWDWLARGVNYLSEQTDEVLP